MTRWEYDAMGRQLRRILPGGQSEAMQYNAAGELVARTDFNGVTTRYSYDAAGRLAGIDYATDADVVTTYTESGQRESVTDGQGTTVYQYDARDRLVHVSYPDGSAIAYGFDAAGNRTSLRSPSLDQRFVFDDLNRLESVHSRVLGGSERVVSYGYDEVGNRTHLTQADGTTTTTGFDERNRLRELLTRTAVGVLLFGATYDVDATGARTGSGEFDATGPTRSVGYAYDGVKRLTAEVIDRPGQPARVTEYSYDAVGNRLTRTEAGVLTGYVVDANDRLLTETRAGVETLYTYDANGNTTGQAKPGAWTRYTFDESNRLVRTQSSAGLDVATGYGAEGVRNRETSAGVTRSWLIDGNRDYAQTLELYANNQLATTWLYGNELLAQSNVVVGGLHERSLHSDGMGSVRQATDASGQLTDAFEYDAFGVELARTGATDIDHRYRSEQLDPNTGFYNLRARWYDAGTGRFVSMDEWQGKSCAPTTLNKFSYADGDPVNGMDPSGRATLSELNISLQIQTARQTGAQYYGRLTLRKGGCELVSVLAEEAVTATIYVFLDGVTMQQYVGQTTRGVDLRLSEHADDVLGKREVRQVLARFEVIADQFNVRDKLRLAEQAIMDELGGKNVLSNDINAISKSRGRLRKVFSKLCE